MKKFFSVLLVLSVIFTMSASLSAAVIDAKYSASAPTGLGTEVLNKGPKLGDVSAHSETQVINLSASGTSFCVKADMWVSYDFEAPKDGTYTFVIDYIARSGSDRRVAYALESANGTVKTLDLEESNDHRFAAFTEELKAGKHSIVIVPAEGFDDKTIKSCDVYGVSAYLTKEAVKPSAPVAEVTSDMLPIAAVVLAISATAAIIISKKHH